MDVWSRQTDRNHEVLMRIVALLVTLAGLADCAAGLSGRRRRNMVAVLVVGEAYAYDFVLGMTPGAEIPEEETELEGDPALLAASFRVLALALTMLLAQARQNVLLGATAPRGGRDFVAAAGWSRAGWSRTPAGSGWPPAAPDTS